MEFSNNLRKIRKSKKLSQEDIADAIGISRQAVAKWENGSAYPDIDNLILLSEMLCMTIDSLVKSSSECIIGACNKEEIPYEELISFLLLAAKNTYAGKGGKVAFPFRPDSNNYIFEQGEYKYIDSYVGGEHFAGEEIVYIKDTSIWAMNYSGRVLEDSFSGDFLKESLLLRPVSIPYRGPAIYQDGGYIYHNAVDGDFEWFQGREEIFYDGTRVYECVYHGGIIR